MRWMTLLLLTTTAAAQETLPPSSVAELVLFAQSKNPRLVKANAAIEAARGRHDQAGRYPNPILNYDAAEIGDRTGPVGIHTPFFSQEIIRGRKLSLSQAVVLKEIDQACLAALSERAAVAASVRAAAMDLVLLEQRYWLLRDFTVLAEQAVEQGKKGQRGGTMTEFDVLPLVVDFERAKAERDATAAEMTAARQRLAATLGDSRLTIAAVLADANTPLPEYDPVTVRDVALSTHPDVRIAQVGVERAQAALRRAQVEPIPNVTLGAGYTYQGQNRSNDISAGLIVPIPAWNRNQGNIRSAQAEVWAAVADAGRAENDLAEKVAIAIRTYAAAKLKAERYRTAVLPKIDEQIQLVRKGIEKGQFDLLRVLQTERSAFDSKLEYNKSLTDAWRAAAELSGYLLEETWPPSP